MRITRKLNVRIFQPLYGFQAKEFTPFRHASGGGRDVHFLEEKEIDLMEVVSGSLPKLPLEVNIKGLQFSQEPLQLLNSCLLCSIVVFQRIG